MHRHWMVRVTIMAAALLQVLAAPLAAIADASLEREAAKFGPPTMHVESSDSAKCPRVHPTECALCQAIASLDAPVRPACGIPAVTWASHRLAAGDEAVATAAQFSRARPRAPPAS